MGTPKKVPLILGNAHLGGVSTPIEHVNFEVRTPDKMLDSEETVRFDFLWDKSIRPVSPKNA